MPMMPPGMQEQMVQDQLIQEQVQYMQQGQVHSGGINCASPMPTLTPAPALGKTLSPVPGASTWTRAPRTSTDTECQGDPTLLISQELRRLLRANTASLSITDADIRSRADAIAEAFKMKTGLRATEVLQRTQWAVIKAAEKERFATAIACGLLTHQQLSGWDDGKVEFQQRCYDMMPASQWEGMVKAHVEGMKPQEVCNPIDIPAGFGFGL
jgi:hypothetical protein